MTTEIKQNPALMITLSILGILTVALIAGLLLMQKQEGKDFDLGTALSFRRELPAADDFDPISWAREGAAYPPLQEAEDTAAEELITDYDGAGAIPEAAPKAPPKAPPEAAPKVTPEVVSTVVRKMVTKVVPKVAPKVAPQPVSVQPSAKKKPFPCTRSRRQVS